ncbi:MAG: MBL fold metallo-hydrolase [Sphingobacteriales bacterium BACL12 MAG-120813-bin55]|jgi:hydroxyacylglutathione hydrolase|nr:MAG: MBL fold metallo-hydrolase [Sphingobacteriales bacterium BACL12 MAG-120813-bin55]
MHIEQIYTGCLAQGAYYITSNGEAAVIDPLREVQPYIDRAARDGVTIKYIFETHFHADFVSGHLDLSKKTGAPIIYGPMANPSFDAIIATDGQEFLLGDVTIRAVHTPGHTMESTCYLLIDADGKEKALFSGDTLFIGDVGRPDLAQKAASMTQEELAGTLYASLRNKIMTLPDDVVVYPAHGAGSACGKNMSKETVSTIGLQKQTNYALRSDMTRDEFIKEVTDGLLAPPAYFPMNVALNKKGYTSFDEVKQKGMQSLSVAAFEAAAEETGALLLDTRSPDQFYKGFIPQSINIGLNGDFAPWVGALIADVQQPLLLITEAGKEEESIMRLSRVGFDNIIGHLEGGFASWVAAGKETDTVNRISAASFSERWQQAPEQKVVDVRKASEYAAEHVNEAYNRPLAAINEWVSDIDNNEHFFLHCAGGYRSMIAASILQARGFRNFTEVEGGFGAIKKTDVSTSDFVCQSKTMAS